MQQTNDEMTCSKRVLITHPMCGLLKKLQLPGRRLRGNRSVLGRYVRIYEEPRTKQMDFFSSLLGVGERIGPLGQALALVLVQNPLAQTD